MNGRVEGPPPMRMTVSGWQPLPQTEAVTKSSSTEDLVQLFKAGREPAATLAAREIATRFVRVVDTAEGA